jgi:hypothetical protein
VDQGRFIRGERTKVALKLETDVGTRGKPGFGSPKSVQTATMRSFARTRRPRRPKLSAKAAKDEKANDASIAPNCAPAGSLAATDYQSPATASMIRAGRFPSFGPKRDLLFHPATTKEA